MKSSLVIIFAVLASNVSAAVAGPRSSDLMRRVSNPNCPQCDQISPAIEACSKDQANATDPVGSCQCSDDIIGRWKDCWSCAVAHGLSADGGQRALDALGQSCADTGHPLSSAPKIDASSPSGSSAASGGAGASSSGSASSPSSTSGAVQIGTRHAVAVAVAFSGVASAFVFA